MQTLTRSILLAIFAFMIFILAGNVIGAAALQQVAGQILVEIKPGETKSFQWGLASDTDTAITVELRAEGEGAEFMSFPREVSIGPGQLVYVNVNVTVPSEYPGDVRLNPALYATEFGETGGTTVINIQMKKIVTLAIDPNENPELRAKKLSNFIQQILVGNQTFEISIESSSNITDFAFNQNRKQLSLKVSGADGTEGTTVIHIGKVLEGPYTVTIDGNNISDFDTITDQLTGEISIKLVYRHSIHEIVITGTNVVPEFPYPIIGIVAALGSMIIILRKTRLVPL